MNDAPGSAADGAVAFRHAPQALWLEDHAPARARLDELGLLGPEAPDDLAGYLASRPALLRELVALARILDVNEATLRRYGCASIEELRAGLEGLYTDVSYRLYAGFWQALTHGESRFVGEDDNATAGGAYMRQEVTFAVEPGAELTWARVIVADVDVTSRALAQRSMRLQRDAAVALAACDREATLFELLLDSLMAIDDVTIAGVYVPDPDNDDFVLAAHRGASPRFVAAVARLDPKSSRLRALASGETVHMAYDRFLERHGHPKGASEPEIHELRGLASVPVMHHGRLVAIVNAGSRTLERLPASTIQTLESIAASAGAALQRVAAQQEAGRRLRYLAALGEIQQALLTRPDGDIGAKVLPRLLEVSGADRAYLFREVMDDKGRPCLDQVAEVVAADITPQIDDPRLHRLPWEDLSRAWHDTLLRGEAVSGRLSDFPDQRATMLEQGTLAMLLLPLFVQGALYGLVGFDNCQVEHTWREPEIALLRSAAAAISAAFEQEQTLQRLHAESGRLQALLGAGRALASSLDYDEILDTVARQAGEALGSSQCVVWEYLSHSNEEIFRALYQRHPEPGLAERLQGTRYHLDDYPADLALLMSGQVRELTLSDPHLDMSMRESMLAWGEMTLLVVPLTISGKPLGELVLIETEAERTFGPAERELARGLGELAAAALANARLHTRVQEQLTVRHDLLALGESLLSQLDEQQVFDQIAGSLGSLVGFDALELGLVDELAREVKVVHATGKDAEIVVGQRYPSDAGVTGRALRQDKPELVNDMLHDPDAEQVPGTEPEEQAAIIVPLRLGTERAVLTLDRFRGVSFGADELETVRLFASLAAVALENARLYRAAEEQAISDGLTGLYNHRHFYERLEQELARARRSDEPVALLMIDLDDFKQLNDSCGHPAGDTVLRIIGRVLSGCTRHGVDLAARYGGEEFAVILPATEAHAPATAATDGSGDEPRSAVVVAERIRAAVKVESTATARQEKRTPPGVTVSIGVAVFPTTAGSMSELVAQADAALYLAKRRGKDRVEVYGIR